MALWLGLQAQRVPGSLPVSNVLPYSRAAETQAASLVGLLHPCRDCCIPAVAPAFLLQLLHSCWGCCIPAAAPAFLLQLLHPCWGCCSPAGAPESPPSPKRQRQGRAALPTHWLVRHKHREALAWRGRGEAEHSPAGAGAGRSPWAQHGARAAFHGADLLPKS